MVEDGFVFNDEAVEIHFETDGTEKRYFSGRDNEFAVDGITVNEETAPATVT